MKIASTLAVLALAAPLVAQDPPAEGVRPEDRAESTWEFLSEKYDRNHDGRISSREYGRGKVHFERLDADGDGSITRDDLDTRRRGRPERDRTDPPKVGQRAPDFTLEVLPPPADSAVERVLAEVEKKGSKGKPKHVKLSSFKGEKPVALIFGSYT